MRPSERTPDQLRAVTLETGVNRYAEGSCLVSFGHTKVLVTASITGAWVAMATALGYLRAEEVLKSDPILDQVAAVSCGIFADTPVLDLDYEEDSNAEADGNFVLTGSGTIVEIQATGEKRGFSRAEFDRLFELAEIGCAELFALQRAALG